jgi:thiol-disulfide isomerase/thioredoxin
MGELGWVKFEPSDQTDEKKIGRSKIEDYKGKVLVLDFYATWCEPCRVSIPRLVDLQRRYKDKGLEVVGLNVGGPDDRVKVSDFAKEFGIQYELGFPDQNLADFLLSDDSSIPQTFVFNRDGTPVKRFVGYQESTTGRLLEEQITSELDRTPTANSR